MTENCHAEVLFKALSDSNRLRILDFLRDGEKSGGEIINSVGIGQTAVSYHMRILCECGIVVKRPVGRCIYYRIEPNACTDCCDYLMTISQCCSCAI